MPLLQNFEMNLMPIFFYYISQLVAQWKCDSSSAFKVGPHLSSVKPFQY